MTLKGRVASAIARHPRTMLAGVAVASLLLMMASSGIGSQSWSFKGALPDDIPAINALNFIEDQFGGSGSAFFALEVAPASGGSDEVRDVRDPRALEYADLLARKALQIPDVVGASSAADLVKAPGGARVPNTLREAKELLDRNPLAGQYVSPDATLSLVRLRVREDADNLALAADLESVLRSPPPAGVVASLAGEPAERAAQQQLIGQTMGSTTGLSLLLIFLLVILTFMSVRFGILPMVTIVLGFLWTFGLVGALGMPLNPGTSAVFSMIMGIGIDFGIQITMRYRIEKRAAEPVEAMERTLSGTLAPLLVTTFAALIGFRAMGLGQIKWLADMGTILTLGVASSMAAAIMAVPPLLLLTERRRRPVPAPDREVTAAP